MIDGQWLSIINTLCDTELSLKPSGLYKQNLMVNWF